MARAQKKSARKRTGRKRKLTEVQVNIDLDQGLVDNLRKFCESSGSPRKVVVELAILKYLNSQRPRP